MNIKQPFQTALKHQNQPGLPGAVMPLTGKENGCSGSEPAGEEGSQPATVPGLSWGIVIENDRDRRALAWLIEKFGQGTIQEAARLMPGGRKPYLSNVAKVLGVKLPTDLQFMPPGDLKEKIQDLRRRLGSAGGGVGVQREGRGPSAALDLTPHSGVPGGEDDHA